jgi:NADH-quinone oxidoreductase subunit G
VSPLAAHTLRYRSGDALPLVEALLSGRAEREISGVDAADITAAAQVLGDAPVTVIIGRANLAESGQSLAAAAAAIHAAHPQVRFLTALRRANVHGALDMGMAPGVLPGRVALDAARSWFHAAWPTVPEQPGLDTAGILAAAAEGRIDTLILLGADPVADFPDRDLAERGISGARTVIAVDLFLTASSKRADVVLAAAGYAEVWGTTTNLEGRVSSVTQKVTAPGTARSDWVLAADLAHRLGHDLGMTSIEDTWAEIERVAPAHAGISLDRLDADADRDGVLVGTARDGAGDGQPPLLDYRPPAYDAPGVDAYSLRLLATRKLWDRGTLVARSPSLAHLAPTTSLRLHPLDFDRLGVDIGASVRVRSARGQMTTTVSPDPDVSRGAAAVGFGLDGADAAAVIDAGAPVTEIRVEVDQ